jgi:hypothetical protein
LASVAHSESQGASGDRVIPTTSTSTAGACARAESEVDQSQTDDNFTDFLSVYPFDPTRMSVGVAREAFDELSIEDQLKAVRFAKPYATAIKAHNRNFPVNRHNFRIRH